MSRTQFSTLPPLAIGILLLAVVFAPVPGVSRAINELHNFAHAPIFGCVAVLVLIWLKRNSSVRLVLQYALAGSLAVGLGLATEVAQAFTGRDASWIDLRSDTLGAAAFLALFACVDRRVRSMALRTSGCVLAVLLLAYHTLPLGHAAVAFARRDREFPVLLDGQRKLDNYFALAKGSIVTLEPLPPAFARMPGEHALRVRLQSVSWPGIEIWEPYPKWRGFRTLAIDITNAEATSLHLALRVNDQRHDYRYNDRFNRGFDLPAQTRTTLRIALTDIEHAPVGREMEIDDVYDLMLFTGASGASREFWVSRIWLE